MTGKSSSSSTRRVGRFELAAGPRGAHGAQRGSVSAVSVPHGASRGTYCWGWPGHSVPLVAEAAAAGNAAACALGAVPRKHTLCSLRLFLFIFSTVQTTQTPKSGPTRPPTRHRARLGASVSLRCWREALPHVQTRGKSPSRGELPSEGPRPLSRPWEPGRAHTSLSGRRSACGPGAGAGGQADPPASRWRQARSQRSSTSESGAGGPDTGCNRPCAGVAGRFWEGWTGCGLPSFH